MRRLAKRNRNLEENKMKTKECYFYKKDEEGFLTEEKIECVATLYEKKDICDCEERFITLSYINDSVFGYDSFDRLDENEIENDMTLEEIFEDIPEDVTDFEL